MSATILWQPTGGGKSLNVGSPSSFKDAMERVFGSFPLVLNESALSQLRAMAAVSGSSMAGNAYDELAEIIEKHGEVRLWAEY
jgi:hypothetical protein